MFVFLEHRRLKASPTVRLLSGKRGKAADRTVNSETWTQ